jgi:hypothetical protein
VLHLFDHHVNNHMPVRLIYLRLGSEMRIVGREDQTHQAKNAATWRTRHDVTTQGVIRELVKPALEYAIFSHRWLREGKPTFHGMRSGRECDNVGFRKSSKFSEKARAMGYKLAWSDTCCIDKPNSAQLDEAIRSMFRWYRTALFTSRSH